MENRINQMIHLENGMDYAVVKQAIYNKENYFVAVQVTEDKKNITDDIVVLHETKENGETFVQQVTDEPTLTILMKHITFKDE